MTGVADLLTGIIASIEAISVSNNPGSDVRDERYAFTHVDYGSLDESPLDLAFCIADVSGGDSGGGGLTWSTFRFLKFSIRVKLINEGLSDAEFLGVVADYAAELQDNVSYAAGVSTALAVNAADPDGDFTLSPTSAEPSVWYLSIPFRVEYTAPSTF